jgi:hypothetical protein
MNRDNEDVVTIRLGDLSDAVERICKRRNISRSDFVKEALSVATRTDSAEAADLFLAFIIFSERMLRCAKDKHHFIGDEEWMLFIKPLSKVETRIRAQITDTFAKKHPLKVKQPQPYFPSIDSSRREDRISVRAWFKMMEVFGDFLDIPIDRREKAASR